MMGCPEVSSMYVICRGISALFNFPYLRNLQENLVMGQPSFQASNAIIYLTYGAFLYDASCPAYCPAC